MRSLQAVLICITILLLLSSCGLDKPGTFEKSGVSFGYPTDWTVTDEESFGEGYYVSLEKDGLTSSGLITITWVNQVLDLEDHLEFYKNEFRNNAIYKNSDLLFEGKESSTFSGFPAISISYSVSIIGIPHEGTLYAFNHNDQTFLVVKQGAIEDQSLNKAGFTKVESSFAITSK